MNKILILLISILLIGSVSAIYAGECMQIDLSSLESLDNVAYLVVGNSSNLNGMIITLNETTKNASVCFVIDYAPDSFTIIFMDDSTKEVIKEIHHYSSGGTRKIYVDRNITEYIILENDVFNCSNQTDIIYLTPEEKGFAERVWEWICYVIKKIFGK